MNSNEKIAKIRKLMNEKGIDAYIIPSSDPHMSEYSAPRWKSRSFISGFTGSAGTLVITKEKSGLWTDGRYFIQAENQLSNTEISLYKMGVKGVKSYIEFIIDELLEGQIVGLDGMLFSVYQYNKMNEAFVKKGIKINSTLDLIDDVWDDRPSYPSSTVILHDLKYTGLSSLEKIDLVRNKMKKINADYYLINNLDSIAWLFNIRGNDISYNPVAYSYALITTNQAFLFIDDKKLTEKAKTNLLKNNITIRNYEDIVDMISSLSKNNSIIYDETRVNWYLYNHINKETQKLECQDIVTHLKALKNETEIKNIRSCHIRDGVALTKFLFWLDNNIGKVDITEITVEEKLEYYRKQQENYMGLSFDTIAGYKANAAMMHYKATKENCSKLEKQGMLLIDSGGQYLDGTTDITRTIVLGDITDEEKLHFTLVLKGHIRLAKARFLYGTTGANLDILARQPLWEQGLDYKCGTGHGVGYFLNVHEGPQNISQRHVNIPLRKGMIVTNEPGMYVEGKYGIRIENILLVQEDVKNEYGEFMKFDTISFCPIDLEGINPALLNQEEKDWLNNYHKKVYQNISPFLNEDEKKWLEKKTRKI